MQSGFSGVSPSGASRGAIRAARIGAAVFLPLAFACAGLLGIFAGPTAASVVRHAFAAESVDAVATGSVQLMKISPSGYGIDDRRK